MNRLARAKLYERRRQVANYHLKGWTQAAIGRRLGIPQGTVSRDLAAIREFWREFPVYDVDKVRLEELQKIDLVEATGLVRLATIAACAEESREYMRLLRRKVRFAQRKGHFAQHSIASLNAMLLIIV